MYKLGIGIGIGRFRLGTLLNQITGQVFDREGEGLTTAEVDAYILSLVNLVAGTTIYYNCIFKLLGNEAPSDDADVLAAIEILINTPYFNSVDYQQIEVLGDELITSVLDREFSSDTGWWTKNFTTIHDGAAWWDNVLGGTGTYIRRLNLLEVGKNYRCVFSISNYLSSSVRISGSLGNNHTIIGGTTPDDISKGTFSHDGIITVDFTAISTTFALEGLGSGTLPTFAIDNVYSLKEIL